VHPQGRIEGRTKRIGTSARALASFSRFTASAARAAWSRSNSRRRAAATGCFQINVNFLHRLVVKNGLEARQKLDEAAAEIVALKSAVTSLQKTVERLQAIQKATGDKKPETK
jgi:hypothetical protein